MSTNRSYFSTLLAAFRAHQPSAAYHQSVSAGTSTSGTHGVVVPNSRLTPPHRSFSSPPHRYESPVSPRSAIEDSDCASPFDNLADAAEWIPPVSDMTLFGQASRSRAKANYHQNRHPSPGGSTNPALGDFTAYSPYYSTTSPSASASSSSSSPYVLNPPSKRAVSRSPPTKSDLAYSPPQAIPIPIPSVQPAAAVRYHVTQQSAVPIRPGPLSRSRSRRGSDSSSEGFRDTGSEKWYIGGTNANGDERFYRLGVIKRPRSVDRLSVDQLSL